MKLGFDIGSKNIHCAVVSDNSVVHSGTFQHNGKISECFNSILQDCLSLFGDNSIESIGLTGMFNHKSLRVIDPISASIAANKFLNTGCRGILSVGCETSYFVELDSALNYLKHSLNSDCASGTGSFIDQQAQRLGYSTDEFAHLANHFKGVAPFVSTQCSVFAKSDIIHAQAEGFSKEAIACGICNGVVRSILLNMVESADLDGDLVLIGGVGSNKKIVSQLEADLGKKILVPREGIIFNALGAALLGSPYNFSDCIEIGQAESYRQTRDRLEINLTGYPDFGADENYVVDGVEVTVYKNLGLVSGDIFIGLDVGSTSSKLIVIDADSKEIFIGLYTSTAGASVDAVVKLFNVLKKSLDNRKINIKGVSVTGSGRELVKEVIGADMAVNEITAHAKGASFIDPEVDTIIEMGGAGFKIHAFKKWRCVSLCHESFLCCRHRFFY